MSHPSATKATTRCDARLPTVRRSQWVDASDVWTPPASTVRHAVGRDAWRASRTSRTAWRVVAVAYTIVTDTAAAVGRYP